MQTSVEHRRKGTFAGFYILSLREAFTNLLGLVVRCVGFWRVVPSWSLCLPTGKVTWV